MNDRDALLELLRPILAAVAAMRPEERRSAEEVVALEAALEREWPAEGATARAIGAALRAGVEAGWLCDRGEPDARFSRLAKPSPATSGLSVDVVRLRGAGLRHGHPQGEVTLGFAVEGSPTFEGRPPGWVFLPPGSVHVPTCAGGQMDLIYFLPAGAVEWTPA